MSEPLYPLLALARHRMEIDGAGVTTLVAGAGCPLSCAYCINKKLLCQAPKPVSAEELFARTRCDDLYFQATGGGLCFGGGESLLHLDFYEALRPLCSGWRFTAETSLNLPRKAVERAAGLIDDFIVDIKTMNAEIYRRYTGRAPAPAYDNLAWRAAQIEPGRLTVRVPRIPGYNDAADQDQTEAALRAMGITRIERFDYTLR